MDIVSSLPVELGQAIFHYLSPRDLKNCLWVNKYWRSVCNSDLLWQKACERGNISVDSPKNDELDELSIYAQRYLMYYRRAKYMWAKNKAQKCTVVQVRDSNCSSSSDGRTLVVSYLTGDIDIFTLKPELKWCQMLNFGYGYEVLYVATDTRTVVALRSNTVKIFNKHKEEYRMEATMAFMCDCFNVIQEDEYGYYQNAMQFEFKCLVEGIVWLYHTNDCKMYLCSTSKFKQLLKISFDEEIVTHTQSSDRVYLLSGGTVYCYTSDGYLQSKVKTITFCHMSVSDNVLASELLSMCLSSCPESPQKSTAIAVGTRYLLHVATLSDSMNLTICDFENTPKTHEYKILCKDHRPPLAKIIMDKFLVCYPGLDKRCYSVFEIPSCRFLYNKKATLNQVYIDDYSMIFISHHFWDINITVHCYKPYKQL